MQTASLLNPRVYSNDEEPAKEFRVFIAYDDVNAGQRAGDLFSCVSRRHREKPDFRLQPWRFDLIADPDWGPFAAAEALQADLLVVSTSNFSALPTQVKCWLSSWLDRKGGTHAAVVALANPESHASSADDSGLQFLQSATKDAGLDFFTPLHFHPHPLHHFIPVPPKTLIHRTGYRHGGINE